MIPEHVQAFLNPETYGHKVAKIQMIQTHISWVFLTGDFVYKLKKPVNLGFVDFSTLEKRKYYCEQELCLNRRLAKDLYIAVTPVLLNKGKYQLFGSGEIVDYCLKMRAFDQKNLFDKLIEQEGFQPKWMDSLAQDIAQFHDQAEKNTAVELNPTQLLEKHIQDNLSIASEHVGQVISEKCLNGLNYFSETMFVKCKNLLKQRQTEQYIRDCHGDLHLRNIALWHGNPVVFDCIEFNETFRIIDTMNDIAFLVMDCEARGRQDLGFRFLSRYLELTLDYKGLFLLNLYLFYRSGVRGKVACLLAKQLSKTGEAKQQEQQWLETQKYFKLTFDYTQVKKPTLFTIGGLSGSGKSHLAMLGCGVERAIVIRSDAIRKRIHNKYKGLDLYGLEMNGYTYDTMFDAARIILEAGFSVILDATFLHREHREQVKILAEQQDAVFHFYWLDIIPKVLKERISSRVKAQKDISDADLSILDKQLGAYQQPQEPWLEQLNTSGIWPL